MVVTHGRARARVRRLSAVVAIGAMLSVAVAAAPSAPAGAASSSNQTLTMAYDFTAQAGFTFDPRDSVTNLNAYIQHLVMGGLFWYDGKGDLRPDLASGYTIVSPTVAEVTLRPNLKFQDGSPLTADEVKASMLRSGSQTTLTMYRNEAVPAPPNAKRTNGTLQSIDVVSPTKLRFTTTTPSVAQLILVLGAGEGVILNSKQFDDPSLKTAPIGAGPYKVTSYSPGTELKLTASDSYWDTKSTTVKNVDIVQNSSQGTGPSQGINRVTTGEIDYFNGYYADTASILAAAKGKVKAEVFPSDTQYIWFNLCKQPYKSLTADVVAGLADLNVRTAMNLMIDRDALNKSIYAGKSEPRTQNWRKGSPFYDAKAAKAFTYNPTKAKEFMAKSAYPNGFEFTVVNNSNPISDRMAEYFQAQWAKIGIKMNILKSLSISSDWFQQLKGPAVETNFIGIQSFKLTQTYDSTRGNNSCGWTAQDPYVTTIKATAPDARKTLTQTWTDSAEKVAADQSEIMTVWALEQHLYNSGKIAKAAWVMDGLGSIELDPTRTKLAAG